jgi:transposase
MSPLSLDLRRRIIAAKQAEKLSVPELAKRFAVGTATVKRLIRRFKETGAVDPLPHGGGQKPKIPAEKLPRVQRLLEANPDWTVEEIANSYNAQEKVKVSRSTMDRAVRRLGFTRKKSLSSPRSATRSASSSGTSGSSKRRETSPLRVWFLWTKPARTRR